MRSSTMFALSIVIALAIGGCDSVLFDSDMTHSSVRELVEIGLNVDLAAQGARAQAYHAEVVPGIDPRSPATSGRWRVEYRLKPGALAGSREWSGYFIQDPRREEYYAYPAPDGYPEPPSSSDEPLTSTTRAELFARFQLMIYVPIPPVDAQRVDFEVRLLSDGPDDVTADDIVYQGAFTLVEQNGIRRVQEYVDSNGIFVTPDPGGGGRAVPFSTPPDGGGGAVAPGNGG